MERLDSPEAKGIRAFFVSTPPKSAQDVEKERSEREKASAEKRAEAERKRAELLAIRESWGLPLMELGKVVKVGRPSTETLWKLALTEAARRLAFGQVPALSNWQSLERLRQKPPPECKRTKDIDANVEGFLRRSSGHKEII